MICKRCDCGDDLQRTCSHPYQYQFKVRGRLYRGTTRTTNRRLAERLAEKAHQDALATKAGIAPIKDIRLSQHVNDYCAHTEKANATAYKDRPTLDRLLAVIGDRDVSAITAFQIEKWKTKRANVVSKTTVNRELNIVRGCFSAAVKWNRLAVSPVKAVADYKVDDIRLRVLNDEELRTVRDDLEDPFVELLCLATVESLARISELLSLQRHHLGPSWVEMRKKGGRVVRVPISGKLRERLMLRAHAGSGFVFGEGEAGLPPTQQTASNRVLRALEGAGIHDASHHTLRHTGVTIMLEKGINPRTIQTLAGWSSLRMLERYGHTRDAETLRAIEAVSAHLENLDAETDGITPGITPANDANSFRNESGSNLKTGS